MSTADTRAKAAPLTVEGTIHFDRRGKAKELRTGPAPAPLPVGRVPRVAKRMALALKFERLVREGAVKDYAELARLGHVTRARVTQIANLALLAPDIQEALLFLPRVESGRDPIILRDLQPIAMTLDWRKQRKAWATVLRLGSGRLQSRRYQPVRSLTARWMSQLSASARALSGSWG
jgi:hypothetical protein